MSKVRFWKLSHAEDHEAERYARSLFPIFKARYPDARASERNGPWSGTTSVTEHFRVIQSGVDRIFVAYHNDTLNKHKCVFVMAIGDPNLLEEIGVACPRFAGPTEWHWEWDRRPAPEAPVSKP